MKKEKKTIVLSALSLLMMTGMVSCGDDNGGDTPSPEQPQENYVKGTDTDGKTTYNKLLFDENGNPDEKGTVIGDGEKEMVFKGKETLKKGTYLLKGWIYVANGSELTIEAGTIIKGDKDTQASLIVEPGGKLIAQGTKDAPIVFTSAQAKGQRKPGDWGGLIICGNAKNNQTSQQIEGGPRTKHGGDNDDDNSGILSYVRVEFAGYPFQKNKEINGVTFGSVGSKTQVDHVQASYSNDDSFEWFGGTVNAKYLVAYSGWDDDFDTDNGFSGNVQYGLVVRNPRLADTSQSNGFESDNCADGAEVSPFTTATFSNITFVGPKAYDGFQNTSDYINGGEYYPNNGSALGKFQAAMQIRRSSHLACFNSIAYGFPIGLIIDGEKGNTVQYAKEGKLKLSNIFFAGMDAIGTDKNKQYEDTPYEEGKKYSFSHEYFINQKGNKTFENSADLLLKDARNVGAGYLPQAGSPVLNAAAWDDAALSSFEKVDYVGAFGSDDQWLDGWTNFDPNNTDY